MKESKIVVSPAVARKLLKKGYEIVDIKPLKEDKSSTIFVFKIEGKFMEDFRKECDRYVL